MKKPVRYVHCQLCGKVVKSKKTYKTCCYKCDDIIYGDNHVYLTLLDRIKRLFGGVSK